MIRVLQKSLLLAIAFASALPALAEESAKELSIEEFLQNLSTVPNIFGRKDPFIVSEKPFEAPRGEANPLTLPVMERYPVANYAVLAVLLGEDSPRALVKLPPTENSKVVIVKLKDKLGNKGGTVERIQATGITVVQNQRSPLGFVDKSEVFLEVGGAEKGPMAPPRR